MGEDGCHAHIWLKPLKVLQNKESFGSESLSTASEMSIKILKIIVLCWHDLFTAVWSGNAQFVCVLRCSLLWCGNKYSILRHLNYSWLSLSRPRLSRITAYLEVKILSLLKHENLTTGKKILWKKGEIAPKEQFLLFSTIFSIYL